MKKAAAGLPLPYNFTCNDSNGKSRTGQGKS
jgi:hypothetical protein